MDEWFGEDEPLTDPRPLFFGRHRELEWLFERVRNQGMPTVISGVDGVGKSALLQQFLRSVRTNEAPLVWAPGAHPDEAIVEIDARIEELSRRRNRPEIVAIDGVDGLSASHLEDVARRIFNFKAVRTLIFVARLAPNLSRAKMLQLEPLNVADASEMAEHLLGRRYTRETAIEAIRASGGLPLALKLLADQIRGGGSQDVESVLRGDIYQLDRQIVVPERKLITAIKPHIITANEALVERLRRHPAAIYELPPRKFEELIAELLSDLGYDVELTPATRDGGKDILAYMDTPHGKALCLVEAKRYRQNRPVGVELVRTLYGTLTDAEASSAMLVTTSSFSPDARSFQQRHQYRLALRDYGHIVGWIDGYRQR